MRIRRLFGNKKAEVPDFISDVFSFFLYLVFFMMFFILFMLSFGGCDKIESQSQRILTTWSDRASDEQFMLNYLRTNLTVDGRDTTYAELIAESCLSGSYEKLIESTQAFMDRGIDLMLQSELLIRCEPDKNHKVSIYRTEAAAGCKFDLVCPSSTEDKVIKIPLPSKEGEVSYARLEMERCEFKRALVFRLSDAQRQELEADLERCVK